MSTKKADLKSQLILAIVISALLALLLMPASVLYTSYTYYKVAHTGANDWQQEFHKGQRFYASAVVGANKENPVAAVLMVANKPYQTEIIWDSVFQDKIRVHLGNSTAQLELTSMMTDNQLKHYFPYVHVSPEVLSDIPKVLTEQLKLLPKDKKSSLRAREILFGLSERDQFFGEFEIVETKPLLLRMKQPLCYGDGTKIWSYYIEQNLFFVVIASILFLFASAIWTVLIVRKLRPKR